MSSMKTTVVIFVLACLPLSAFELSGNRRHWPDGTIIKWHSDDQYVDAMRTAVRCWSIALQGNLSFQETTEDSATLKVFFDPYVDHDADSLALAQETVIEGVILDSSIHVYNGDGLPTDKIARSSISLVCLLLHEIGHSLGLEHSSELNAVMYQKCGKWESLHKDDIDGISSLYGLSPVSVDFSVTASKVGSKYVFSTDDLSTWKIDDSNVKTVWTWNLMSSLAKPGIYGPSKNVTIKKKKGKIINDVVVVDCRGWTKEIRIKSVGRKQKSF